MVDAIVSTAVQSLSNFVIEKATFLLGVKDDVEWMRDELRWMQSFLKDAEQKQDTDHRIRLWISEIKCIASEAEVIVDNFSAEVKGTEPSKRKLLTSTLQKCFCVSSETNVYDIGKEVKQLKERLLDVSRKREVYGISALGNAEEVSSAALGTRLRDLRRTTSHADQEYFVGFEDDVKLLETQLLSFEPRLHVVSILGMGGLGKTTLARKVYKNTKSAFDLQAWICVSQEWNQRDLLERIIKSFKMPTHDNELNMLEKMKDYDMERYLCDLLKQSRYLVVIDDLWDKEAWECLRRALPDNHNRSRIIITTRIEVVAGLSDKRTYVHKLRLLRPDESWELFCKKAFQDSNEAYPQDMEEIGKQMVAKCGGLPLGILVLGGLLSRKQYGEWHTIKKNIWKALKDDSIHISAFLDLSYNDLPHELKPCFLYFSLFPEDYVIHSTKLVQLWVAEGLIPEAEGLDLEELAGIYLNELSGRSLIQVVKNEGIKHLHYSIHDLLRDLVVNKAKYQNFLQIYDETSGKAFSSRWIAFRSGFESYIPCNKSHTQVRTISFLDYRSLLDEGATRRLLMSIQTQFSLLRVLDLVGLRIETTKSKLELFEATGKLIHLKYLGLKFEFADITQLPESIGNMQALQTLDVSRKGGVCILPRDMYKLKQLRHLKGRFITNRGDDIFGPSTLLERLTNLQTLNRININGLLRDEKDDELDLSAFSKLCNLKALSVEWRPCKHKLSVEPLFSCSNLVELTILGSLKNLPVELHEFLPKLEYLILKYSAFKDDPVPALEKLPNLVYVYLHFITGNEVKSMVFGATGFPKLETLWLFASEDTKLEVEEGAMPRLNYVLENDFTKNNMPKRLRPLLKKY